MNVDVKPRCRRVLDALQTLRVTPMSSEYALHDRVADCLRDASLPYAHEVVLAPRRRIDFVCEGIGIEIKRGKPVRSRLRDQLTAYAVSPALDAIIVLVERNVTLPRSLAGKPVLVLSLNRLWGIALP